MVALAVSSAPAWAGRQRTTTTARPCAARAKKELDASTVTRRSLGAYPKSSIPTQPRPCLQNKQEVR